MGQPLLLSEAANPETYATPCSHLMPVLETALLVTVPLENPGVVGLVNRLPPSRPKRYRLARAVLGTLLTDLTELYYP